MVELETYTPKFPLFKALDADEVKAFKKSVSSIVLQRFYWGKRSGRRSQSFTMKELGLIHPVVRKELIRLIEESLKEQNEL
jgi:hypothetical protein